MNYFGVIMAGGGGTRFWPLSREKKPKQLLNLSGKGVMVNEAIERLRTVVERDCVFIVTSDSQATEMKNATRGKLPEENILVEPSARNTAACIGYAAMEIVKKYGDGVMIITPADQYVEDVSSLSEAFHKAACVAENDDKLVTIGLKPSFPSSGFGYIKYDVESEESVRTVIEFREKPDVETAQTYIDSGQYAWNSGMFIWKASCILEKLQEYVPDIYSDLSKIGEAMNTAQEQSVLNEIYPQIRKISIDYAVMEPSAIRGEVMVVPCECGWHDLGSWDMMDVLHKPDENGNILVGDVFAVNSKQSVIYSTSRTVTAVDVDNLVIVETPDAIMICPKDKAQDVKKIVDLLKETGRKELL